MKCSGLIVLLLSMALGGCKTPATTQAESSMTRPSKTRPLPTYLEIAERYNRNIAKIDRLWTGGTVELRWKDRGKSRFEQGDVHLIVIPPTRVAFEINKAGITLLWAGADAERYWLFDMQGDKTAYVGAHADYGKTVKEVPMPIHPLELVRLLGITPLPPPDAAGGASVEWVGDDYLVEFPGRMRLIIDPKTALPTRIDLLDEKGFSRVIAKVSAPDRVELENTPPGGFPTMNTRFEITMTDREGRMTLFLERLTNNHEKINERVFDFDFLKKRLKPETVHELK